MKIKRKFFERDAEIVARELLGKIIVRNLDGKEMRGRIVETEAYYDNKDPASRACKEGDLKKTMEKEAGTILVYGVHNSWLINFVTGKKGEAEAVLIRALEPLNFKENTKGPGLLCKALKIDKSFHKKVVGDEELWLENDEEKEIKEGVEVVESKRIGVKKDLEKNLRFYIKDNKWVSKK